MIFPYWQVHRGGESRFLPLVPLTLHGPQDTLEILALVDSGAEHTVCSADLAVPLGLDLQQGTPVRIAGVGGNELPGHLIELKLQLKKHHSHAPVIFAAGLEGQVLLGQAGFFAFYTVTFQFYQLTMDIRRVRMHRQRQSSPEKK